MRADKLADSQLALRLGMVVQIRFSMPALQCEKILSYSCLYLSLKTSYQHPAECLKRSDVRAGIGTAAKMGSERTSTGHSHEALQCAKVDM